MKFSLSQAYIASNPKFTLAAASRPKLQRGQMTIVFERLEKVYPNGLTLEQLVLGCEQQAYRDTFTNPKTDIRKSILYHLNRIESVRQVLR